MKNILITGCNGYIGSCISTNLKKNYFTIGIDKKNYFLNKKIVDLDLRLNLNNFSLLKSKLKDQKIDLIIHLAGQSTIDNISNIKSYNLNNINVTKNLIKISKILKINKIIFSSTAAVYKKSDKLLKEKSYLKPNNIYGKTKLICEKLIKKEFSKKNK